MKTRVTPFQGIHNFRDYGGYPALDGARLKPSLLFRSGQHVDATADDLETVAVFGLKTIIDLRGDSERRLYPCARPPGFEAVVLFVDGETAGSGHAAPHVAAARDVRTADDARTAMVDLYRVMPFRPNLLAILRLYFDALAGREGASLLHCLAGKDRTGLAVALLHALMGVHHDDLMEDYLLTNIAGNIERRIAAGASVVRANFGQGMEDGAIRTLMSVEPAFLDAAFGSIRERHGSVEAYAEALLGVTPRARERIAARLLA